MIKSISKDSIFYAIVYLLIVFFWFYTHNYYVEYEAFFSKIYLYNFGSSSEPLRFEGFSPLGFIFFEKLLGTLYNHRENLFWYDYLMFSLLSLAYFQLIRVFKAINFNYISQFLSIFIIFFWLIKLQNHTHISYLLSFCSLWLVFVSSQGASSNLRDLVLGNVGFLLSLFLRWETAFIAFIIFISFAIIFKNEIKWKKVLPTIFISITTVILIIWIFRSSKEFYRQIEPDGEYVVLYEKALRLPPNATALDTLKYEMLNNWIVDDTTLISIDYFKEAVAYAKSFRDKDYYLNKLKEGWSRFQEHLKKRWYMSLFFFFLALYLVYYQNDYRFLFFLLIVYCLIFFIAYKSLLTERHYFSILGGIFLFSFIKTGYLHPKVMVLVLLIISTLLSVEINKNIHAEKNKHEKYVQNATKILNNIGENTLYLDFQYIDLFNNNALKKDILIDKIKFTSLSQHSYNEIFVKHIRLMGCNTPLDKIDFFSCIIKKKGYIYLIINNQRLEIMNKIFQMKGVHTIKTQMIMDINVIDNKSLKLIKLYHDV